MANMTKSYVESAPFATTTVAKFIWDNSIKGFGVRITVNAKAFIVDRKFQGRSVRISIGRFPTWTVQQARERARELIVMMDKGIDPREEEKKKAEQGITLAEAFERFITERQLKERTKLDYQRYLDRFLIAWKDKPINRIDSDMVMRRYLDIANSRSGPAQASSVMRFLRSVLNYAQAIYGAQALPFNPVASLTARRAWIRDGVRTDHLRPHQIKPFVEALRAASNRMIGGYLEFILLTGARRGEAAQLRWRDVDEKAAILTFRNTKNHSDRTLPITPRMGELLQEMKGWKIGEYVFATMNKEDKPAHVVDPRKVLNHANKAAESEVTIHGLRRTYATLLESLDCPPYPLKALLGHSLRGDVTTNHYTQIGVERLRPWAQKYEAKVISLINDPLGAKVVTLGREMALAEATS